jgi:hypothetical protein
MSDDQSKRALMLLHAPELSREVVAVAAQLGDRGREVLRDAALGKQKNLTQKQRAHALDLLVRTGDLEDQELQKLASGKSATVRRHALLALQGRGRADLLLDTLRHEDFDRSDQAIVLSALARVGRADQVKETLGWAAESEDVDLRNLAAAAIRAMRRRTPSDDLDDLDLLTRAPDLL